MTKLAIIPFLFIALFYFVNKKERFNNNFIQLTKPKIIFLDKNYFNNFITSDPDSFFKNLSVYDLRARKVLSSSDYINKILNDNNFVIDQNITRRLTSLCNISDNIILKFYPELYSIDWNICIFNTKMYEGGYPHTRSNIIFMPLDYILNADNRSLMKTLIHEKIHILQRLYPDSNLVSSFMLENNFTKYKTLLEMRQTHPRCRSNPDMDEWIYCDDNKFYVCEYTKDYPDNIMDVIQDSRLEHPNEIMAYKISEELMKFY